jgi:hypothetical protein
MEMMKTYSKNPIHEAVEFYWGERCPEHDPNCPTCKAWREYDIMTGKNVTDEEGEPK